MAPTEVQRWQTRQDGLANLFRATAPLPSPGPNEVLVKINAVSFNYRDTEVAMGLYSHHKTINPEATEPLVPASDMCGSIAAVGPDVSAWAVGDRVVSIFNQTHLTGQIKAADMKSGLGFPLEGVLQTYRVFPATGLIAKAAGAKVLITSSSDAKLEKAKALGADYTVNYRTQPNWDETVNSVTNGEGADIILETGGAKTLRRSFEAIGFGGTIACIGYLSGKVDSEEDRTNVNLLALRKTVTLKGIINGPRERFEEMVAFYEDKGIKPVVDRVFAFDEADEALRYLYSGGHFGKVVVKVQE
ncbi:Zinc-type alcohol dehydrogenase-like protein [Colletotrichum sp. SAR 10_65]|nr:Zinc-type alcohol dehydrogenase-like protein [Colletotrichum sp. SAR 10_65]